MNAYEIKATARSDEGKGASRRLRRAGRVPAIVYGSGTAPVSIEIEHNHLWNKIGDEKIFSSRLTLSVDGKTETVMFKDMQRHPFEARVMHVDFIRVTDTSKVTKLIPLNVMNGAIAVGVKAGGLMTILMPAIELVGLAKDMPTQIDVDVKELDAGQSIRMSDLQLPAGIQVRALQKGGSDYNHSVVIIGKARKAR